MSPIQSSVQRQLVAAVMDELKERGETQATLAQRVGISEKHLSQMLTGTVQGTLAMWSRVGAGLSCRWNVELRRPSSTSHPEESKP